MKLYLDTEFNGHGGQLISLAIASPTGVNFYGVLPLPKDIEPWVDEHVVPVLASVPAGPIIFSMAPDREALRAKLIDYLRPHQGATIVADWPGDFRHLLECFEGANFMESWCPRFNLQLIVTPEGEPKPETPHNALSDALALMRWDMALEAN